jgi:hypothetical protein
VVTPAFTPAGGASIYGRRLDVDEWVGGARTRLPASHHLVQIWRRIPVGLAWCLSAGLLSCRHHPAVPLPVIRLPQVQVLSNFQVLLAMSISLSLPRGGRGVACPPSA